MPDFQVRQRNIGPGNGNAPAVSSRRKTLASGLLEGITNDGRRERLAELFGYGGMGGTRRKARSCASTCAQNGSWCIHGTVCSFVRRRWSSSARP